ncbi:hypothetical protein [Alteromonas sp. M12]|uniref:hypothetical protein n=1 Tax=Alteromonas sp. M12 TaxID=3135644 RepID=UPI00319DC6DF
MKKNILPFIVFSPLSMLSFASNAASPLNEEANSTKVMVVDHYGKPPFKRSFVEAKKYDVVQFKAESSEQQCVNRITVSMRSKPPYKRSIECVPIDDVAQFELTGNRKSANFRGSPPFKRR